MGSPQLTQVRETAPDVGERLLNRPEMGTLRHVRTGFILERGVQWNDCSCGWCGVGDCRIDDLERDTASLVARILMETAAKVQKALLIAERERVEFEQARTVGGG